MHGLSAEVVGSRSYPLPPPPPPQSQFRGQGIHIPIWLCDLRDASLEKKHPWTNIWNGQFKLVFVMLICIYTGQNTVIRMTVTQMIILIAYFALVWKHSLPHPVIGHHVKLIFTLWQMDLETTLIWNDVSTIMFLWRFYTTFTLQFFPV